MTCININSLEYKQLLKDSGFKPEILKAKISLWQDVNGFDSFPTLKDLGINPSTVNAAIKSLDLLTTDKAEKLFKTLEKNKVADNIFWIKVQQDLAIPKEQIEILKSFNTKDRNQLITDLLANYSYTVEIDTAKTKTYKTSITMDTNVPAFSVGGIEYFYDEEAPKDYSGYFKRINDEDEIEITQKEYDKQFKKFKENEKQEIPTQHYSNLTVPGGTNYTENEIATPAITPSIKGHAQFATDKGIGWFRSDDKENKVVGWKEEDDFLNSETAQYNPITKDDKIIFGHPTIGKSYLKQKGNNDFITLDDDYKDEVNAFVDANRGSETRQEYKGRKPKEYNEFMLNLFDRLKVQAKKEGKRLFVSNTNILKERMSEFDKVITIPKDEFKKRFDARGATYGFEDWKSDIDTTVAKVDKSKVISTTGYLSDLLEGNPKTRRILEVQSDLFQKGRDKADLVGIKTTSWYGAENLDKAIIRKNNRTGDYYIVIEGDLPGFETYVTKDGEKTATQFTTKEEAQQFIDDSKKPNTSNQFLQLLNKDNNWVTFFIKSIIQDSAKKGYEKVLFPRIDTIIQIESAGKFKIYEEASNYYNNSTNWIQKEKELDEEIEEIKKDIESIKKSDKNKYPYGNKILTKQEELERQNSYLIKAKEERASNRPTLLNTAKFYENDISNILNKTYGKDNVKVITDEYGNTWNEINLKESDLNPIYFQKEISTKEKIEKELLASKYFTKYNGLIFIKKDFYFPAIQLMSTYNKKYPGILTKKRVQTGLGFKARNLDYVEINDQLVLNLQKKSKGTVNEALDNIIRIFLSKANFNVEEVFDEIKTRTGENATASVDLFNRLIKISKNKQGEDTLTEEAAHVLEAMLGKNHPLYQKMFDLIEQTEVWESTLSEYNTVYDGNLDKIKFEAIGKMITKVAVQKFKKNELNTTSNTVWDKFSKLVQAAFKWLSNKFKNVPDTFESEIEKVYGEAADMLLTGNVPEIKSTQIKPGVNFVFQQNPELSNIGTQEQYSQYLDQIFPDSKVKDIVYHGTNKDFSEFVSGKGFWGNAFYVTAKKEYANSIAASRARQEPGTSKIIKPLLINANNIEFEEDAYAIDEFPENIDTILTNIEGGAKIIYAVNKPEQIHILGNKQDIQGFKEFVNNQTFFQLDSDKKKKSDYKDAIQEQIERSEIKIQRIKKQTPNWKNNPKASVAISKLEEYIKKLKEERALSLIENKANNELNAIEAKLEDLDNIADKEGFFTYALETLKGWQDLDEFITYPEDKEGKNRIIAMTGRANNLEKILMNKFQEFASEKYGEDFNSSIVDESFFGANFLDIAQSKIPILRKIGEFINKARFVAYELTKNLNTEIDEEFSKLKQWSGYKSDKELWNLFRQKDSKGNWTGNYVAEISNSFYEKKAELAKWAKENKSFSAYYRWLNANTTKVFDKEAFDAMYEQVKLNEFTQSDGTIDNAGLQAWAAKNGENANGGPFIKYNPKVELWKDKQYEYIQSVPELKRFYDFFINTLEERMSVLPSYEKKQSNYLPELKRNTFLDFSKGGMTGLLKEWTNQFKDSFANDIESSKETVLRDPITGEPEKTIPVYMMADRLNPEDKEYDLTKVLKSFGAMSYMYEQKNAIEEPVKLMSSLFRNLKEKLVAESTDKTDRFGKLVEILDGNKQAVSMMDYHIDAMLYDKTREDDTTKKLGEIVTGKETKIVDGKEVEVDIVKKVTAGSIIDWLINYTRIKGLAGNIFSGVTNSTFGISANFIHAEGKVDFNPTQAMDALGIMLNAVIKGSDTNKKVNFLMEKFRIKPEAVSSEGANISKYLYAFTEAGEYINYGQTGIATLLNTKVKNLKGETKDLYDAYIIQNGKVVWNTKEFGPEQYTDLSEEKYNLATKIQGLNKRIHGNYDPESPIKIKSHVWGRAVMIFRSWLPMAIYTRFGSVNMSKELGREVKGRYITGLEYAKQNKFGVLLPVFKELMTQVINTSTLNRLQLESGAFDELSELDRENMLRNVAELRYILFFMALGTILRGMTIDDEDEEKVALTKFLINQTDRVEGELSFFFSPYDQSRIATDISPVSRTFKDFYDLVPATTRLITGEDELKSGPNKGNSNFYRQLKQAVPIITQIQKAKELKDLNVDNPMVR